MRINHLYLKAFGPFTEVELDFSSALPGLHIVYGDNEAGKSSCLWALNYLFFGIHPRTAYNFIHAYDKLLIGGQLENDAGESLTFYRRKKRKADLFDEHDHPMDPSCLEPFFHGMEKEVFESLYGIGHAALVRGGEDILDQKGDVGQAIFAAGAGLTSLHKVLEELEDEAGTLFKPQASKPDINEALSRYRDLKTRMKQSLLSGSEWDEHRRTLKKDEKHLSEIQAKRREKDREKRRLERLKRSLGHLSRRREVKNQLADQRGVIVLPPDFSERRRVIEQERDDAIKTLTVSTARLDELKEKMAGISLKQDLLNRAGEIEGLYKRSGAYKKGTDDRPGLEGQRIRCKTEAAALLEQVRPDLPLEQVETLRAGLLKQKTISSLGKHYEALVQRIEKAEEAVRKHLVSLEKSKKALSELPPYHDPGSLEETVRLAQRAGDVDEELNEKRRQLKLAHDTCQMEMDRLGLWKGPLERISGLPVPIDETVNRFEQELEGIDQRESHILGEKEKVEQDLNRVRTELKAIQYTGEVPTEVDLFRIRSERDTGWQLIRRHWVEGEDVTEEVTAFSTENLLPDTYERLVTGSDETADRLRREADRVQKQAVLKSEMEDLEKRQRTLETESEQLIAEHEDASQRWQDIWTACDISPLSPREMRQWLNGFEQIRFKLGEARKTEAEMKTREQYRQELRRKLIHEIQAFGSTEAFTGDALTPVLVHAEALLEANRDNQAKGEKEQTRLDESREALETSENEKGEAEKKRELWRSEWKEALVPLGLSADSGPDDAADFMDTVKACFERVREADEFGKRINGIDRDNRTLEKDLRSLLKQVAPDLLESEAVQAINDLQARLNEARKDDAVLRHYMEQTEALEKDILEAKSTLNRNESQMNDLLKQAGCDTEDGLDEAEQRSTEHQTLKDKLQEIESTLVEISEGVSIESLEREAQELDPNELPGRIGAVSREITDQIDPEITKLTEGVIREKSEMERMDGSSRAALRAEESQEVLARIQRLTERFIRLKLSSRILLDVIEQYRVEHQDPLLEKASRYFRDITLGSFRELRTDINDQGRPILIGVRPDGAWLKVEAMSDGTRDQLFLALRLATLDWRVESSEAMPFIVDDIMINFDDERSRATLHSFSTLAERNQIILFTHHRRITEIAKTMDVGERVFMHDI